MPLLVYRSTSTVGFPRLSTICRAFILVMTPGTALFNWSDWSQATFHQHNITQESQANKQSIMQLLNTIFFFFFFFFFFACFSKSLSSSKQAKLSLRIGMHKVLENWQNIDGKKSTYNENHRVRAFRSNCSIDSIFNAHGKLMLLQVLLDRHVIRDCRSKKFNVLPFRPPPFLLLLLPLPPGLLLLLLRFLLLSG